VSHVFFWAQRLLQRERWYAVRSSAPFFGHACFSLAGRGGFNAAVERTMERGALAAGGRCDARAAALRSRKS
jgi:hypothetical protein